MTKMKAPADVSNVSHDGKIYLPKNGVVEVPDDAVEALKRHGFRVMREVLTLKKPEAHA